VVYLAAVTRLVATLWFLASATLGCGYKTVGYGAGFDGIRTVAIETPANETFFPGAEFVVADALRQEFLRRGAARLIEDPAAADLVVSGRVTRIRTSGRSLSSVTFTLEYQLEMVLDLEARRPDGPVWPIAADTLRAADLYLSSADVEATRKNRDEAMRRVASILAQRVHDSLFEAAFR